MSKLIHSFTAEITIEISRKELVDLRRQLTDSNFEKEKYNSTNKELRERIKQVETEKREQARTLEDSYQKIAGLEDAKTSLEADRNRLQNNLRETEREALQLQQQLRMTQEELEKSHNANSQAQNNEKELEGRLANEIEERERLQLQLHQMKKKVWYNSRWNSLSQVKARCTFSAGCGSRGKSRSDSSGACKNARSYERGRRTIPRL